MTENKITRTADYILAGFTLVVMAALLYLESQSATFTVDDWVIGGLLALTLALVIPEEKLKGISKIWRGSK